MPCRPTSDSVSRENALASHDAVLLPWNYSERWITVGADETVNMGYGPGVWYTCNYGASAPEGVGIKCNWADASADGTHPTISAFNTLDSFAERIWIVIHGKEGLVMKASDSTGFIFLPKIDEGEGAYWSSNKFNYDIGYSLLFGSDCDYFSENDRNVDEALGVRFLQN